jgi:hypothetical protein
MPARRSNRALASLAAWVAATCGLALGSAACTDGTTADCSDAQCQVVVEVIDTGASANSGVDGDSNSGVDGDSNSGVDGDSSAGVDGDSSAGVDGDSSAGVDGDSSADAGDGARE